MFASDVYGVVLGYYDNDYCAIKTVGGPLKPFELAYAGSDFDGASDGLYNGNIRNATVSLRRKIYYGDTDISMSPIGYAYTYDQLNRYVKMRAYNNYDTATNEWQSGGAALQDYAETVSYDGNGNILNYIRHGNPTIGTPTGLTAMDSMTYSYNAHNNQLNSVTDGVPKSNYTTDIDNEVANNYLYDKNGEMTYDSSQHLKITWNVRNKVATVMNDSTHLLITFGYDAMGNRVMKKDSNLSSGKCYALWYIRDAQGNVLSMYKERHDSMWWQEADIYGSSRVGVYYADSLIYPKANQVNANDTFTMELWEGKRQYGLVNHLGNVLTTISDKKIMLASNATPNSGSRNAYGNIIDYQPEVVSINDYYPGGMPLVGRIFSLSNDSGYRFGYNKGSEKDDDIEGKGNEYTTEFRELDVRLGPRWWSVDPKPNAFESAYLAMKDNPLWNNDANGDEADGGVNPPKNADLFITDDEAGTGSTGDNKGGTNPTGGSKPPGNNTTPPSMIIPPPTPLPLPSDEIQPITPPITTSEESPLGGILNPPDNHLQVSGGVSAGIKGISIGVNTKGGIDFSAGGTTTEFNYNNKNVSVSIGDPQTTGISPILSYTSQTATVSVPGVLKYQVPYNPLGIPGHTTYTTVTSNIMVGYNITYESETIMGATYQRYTVENSGIIYSDYYSQGFSIDLSKGISKIFSVNVNITLNGPWQAVPH